MWKGFVICSCQTGTDLYPVRLTSGTTYHIAHANQEITREKPDKIFRGMLTRSGFK